MLLILPTTLFLLAITVSATAPNTPKPCGAAGVKAVYGKSACKDLKNKDGWKKCICLDKEMRGVFDDGIKTCPADSKKLLQDHFNEYCKGVDGFQTIVVKRSILEPDNASSSSCGRRAFKAAWEASDSKCDKNDAGLERRKCFCTDKEARDTFLNNVKACPADEKKITQDHFNDLCKAFDGFKAIVVKRDAPAQGKTEDKALSCGAAALRAASVKSGCESKQNDQVEFKKCLCTGKGMRDALAAGNMKNCEDKKEQETFANGICKGVDGFQPVKF